MLALLALWSNEGSGESSHMYRLKSVSSATETNSKIEISFVASLDMILSNKRTTKALIDQTVRMRRLVDVFVFRKPPKTGFLA